MANLLVLAARVRQAKTDWKKVHGLLREAISDPRFLPDHRPIPWLGGDVYDADEAARHVALLCHYLSSRVKDFPEWRDFDWRPEGLTEQCLHPFIADPNGDVPPEWNLTNEELYRAREDFKAKRAKFTEGLAQLLESYADPLDEGEGLDAQDRPGHRRRRAANQFHDLAEQFRGLDSDGSSAQEALDEYSAQSMRCVQAADVSGEINLAAWEMDYSDIFSTVEEATTPATAPSRIAWMWASKWYSFVEELCRRFPKCLPVNPNVTRIVNEADGITSTGFSYNEHMGLRAQNYAKVCDWLANKVDASKRNDDDDVDVILAEVKREQRELRRKQEQENERNNRRTRLTNAFNSAVGNAIHVGGFLRKCGIGPGTVAIPDDLFEKYRDWQTEHILSLHQVLTDEDWTDQLDQLPNEGPPERRVALAIVRAAARGDASRVRELLVEVPPTRFGEDEHNQFTNRVYVWLKQKICAELTTADIPRNRLVPPVAPAHSNERSQLYENLLPQEAQAGSLDPAIDQQLPSVRAGEKAKGKGKKEKRIEWLARAMLLVQDHPEWSDAEIARRVSKDKSTLSRSKEYQAAAAIARAEKGTKADIPKGHQTKSDTGLLDVDAISSEDDPAEMDWDD